MIKSKAIIITTACLFVALCVAAVGLTFAWYTNRIGADSDIELDAEGYLVVYFDEEVNTDDSKLKPAVATLDAVRDGADFRTVDVTTTGPLITTAATQANFKVTFHYVNATKKPENAPDDWVPPASNVTFSRAAKIKFAEESGREALAMELERDIRIKVTVTVQYRNQATAETPVDLWQDGEGYPADTPESIVINGDADVTVAVTAYLLQPDELANPALLDATAVQITIGISAVPVGA